MVSDSTSSWPSAQSPPFGYPLDYIHRGARNIASRVFHPDPNDKEEIEKAIRRVNYLHQTGQLCSFMQFGEICLAEARYQDMIAEQQAAADAERPAKAAEYDRKYRNGAKGGSKVKPKTRNKAGRRAAATQAKREVRAQRQAHEQSGTTA